MKAVAAKHFPGVPLVPLMSTGATDGVFLAAIGIPVYGVPGMFLEPDLNGIHGLNERIRVESLYDGRDYLFDLVKAYRRIAVDPAELAGGIGGAWRRWFPFRSVGTTLIALPQGALFWPARRALLVADLHLEKASWFARFGQMLPPYDSMATLRRLTALVAATGAREVWCLGDSFHDAGGCERLPERARRTMLRALTGRTRWTWITGNHDRGMMSIVAAARWSTRR